MTWGCFNRAPLVNSYGKWGIDQKSGETKYFEVKNVMSKECQYSKRSPDPKCVGCKWQDQH